MDRNMRQLQKKAASARRFRRGWKQLTLILSLAVVLFTVSALVLPAVTMEQTYCGLEEHIHDETCCGVENPLVLGCQVSGTVLHRHEGLCYDELGQLRCTLPELEAHVHGEECYTLTGGHAHTADCDPEGLNVLFCGQVESDPVPELTCTLPEACLHTHEDGCYMDGALVCGLAEATEHLHTEACLTEAEPVYICGLEAHTHEEACMLPSGEENLLEEPVDPATGLTESQAAEVAELVELIGALPTQDEVLAKQAELAEDPYGWEWYYNQLVQEVTALFDRYNLMTPEQQAAVTNYAALENYAWVLTTTADLAGPPDVLPVYYYAYVDGAWTLVGTSSRGWVYTGSSDVAYSDITRDAIPMTQVQAIYGKFGFTGNVREIGYQLLPEDDNNIWSDTSVTTEYPDAGGVTVLPLSRNSLGYNLYYLPGNTEKISNQSVESLTKEKYLFYSISVDDPQNVVYNTGSAPITYVRSGGTGSISVNYTSGITWSVSGGTYEEPESSAIHRKYTFTDVHEKITLTPSLTNPDYTVQYYAWLNIGQDGLDENGNPKSDVEAKMIDTRNGGNGTGGNLPTNTNVTFTSLYLAKDTTTNAYRFFLERTLTPIFTERQFLNTRAPGVANVDRVSNSHFYTIKEVWVPFSVEYPQTDVDPSHWQIYTDAATAQNYAVNGELPDNVIVVDQVNALEFTTDQMKAVGNVIYVAPGATIRLVYTPDSGTYSGDTTFYDYDITDGVFYSKLSNNTYSAPYTKQPAQTSILYLKTNKQGINNATLSYGSGTRLAFGNNNANSGYGNDTWNDGRGKTNNTPNKAALDSNGKLLHSGCTFGIASHLDADGKIVYSSGIAAPDLFSNSHIAGAKTVHSDYKLNFYRNGDTYTLQSVQNKKTGAEAASNLMYLQSYGGNTPSNNFWPMDDVSYWQAGSGMAPGHDPAFGDDTTYYSGGYTVKGAARRYGSGIYTAMPISDDGNDHNSYFGMHYSMTFSVTEDYIGPLEYAFFGDDDMWVFLDGKLVCDIGGVHVSVGSYVDLWDHLKKGEAGTHRLDVYYMERGASGSTCWINFTLPSAASTTLSEDTGGIQIRKTVQDTGGNVLESDDTFRFQVDLRAKKKSDPLLDESIYFPVQIRNSNNTLVDTTTLHAGGVIELQNGQYATIAGIPNNVYYEITELDRSGYMTYVNGASGYITSGTIGSSHLADFVNVPGTEMPSTGGSGTTLYIFSGLALVVMAGALMYKKRKHQPCP